MVVINFQEAFEKLKRFYACGKCKSQEINIPILLKACRHIFCTKCLVIRGKQHCPQCGVLYNAMEIDRGNKFVTKILEKIKNIEQICLDTPSQDSQVSEDRYILEYDPKAEESGLFVKLLKLFESISDCEEETASESASQASDVIIETDSNRGSEKSKRQDEIVKNPIGKKRKSSELSNVGQAKKFKSQPMTTINSNEKESTYIEATDSEKSNSNSDKKCYSQLFGNVKLCKVQLKRNPKGETPLHLACKKRQSNVVKELIEEGMDVNCVDWANWTPLHEAILSQDETSARFLLEAGCLVNVPAANYATPLHQAVSLQNMSLITLLIDNGANPNVKDITGKTPNDFLDTPLKKQTIETPKALVFNCDSSKSGPRAVKLTELQLLASLTTSNNMEHLVVDGTELSDLFVSGIMAALLKAVPIIPQKDVENFLKSTNMNFLHLIPSLLQDAFKKSLNNRLNRLPRLFDGMNIHLPTNIGKYKVRQAVFSRDQLQGLIEIGGGTILKRAPSEATVEGVSAFPYHCQTTESLRNCAHYIVYDEDAPQQLLYKMKELRHVSAQWIIECVWQFQLRY